MSFLEDLAKKGLIKENQIGEIKNLAREKHEGNVDPILMEMGLSEEKILEAKGEYLRIPIRKINAKDTSFNALKYIPEDSAVHYHFVPVELKDNVLEVGVLDPENVQAMDALQFISAKAGIPFKIFLISESDYKVILESYKGIGTQVEGALDELSQEEEELKNANDAKNLDKELKKVGASGESKIVEDAPVIKIVAVLLRNALSEGASDIHIEHIGEKVKVRFRVDGLLHTALVLPPNVYNGIVARIKILAKLRLDEKRKPQDGSFNTVIDGRKIDFRVSTMPAYFGEKVVMRILDSEKGVKPLEQLGLSERNMALLKEALGKPYGLILITGPTGSGKSTTLYSMLNALDKEGSNIVSLEDPVEYHMPDINQSQMMPEIGYTFASGLRSILRQDPDVIMVGEIRDKETAQLAIQAALTGHLVLSTLHTNNAIGTVSRLVDMGVDPYLIAPTLILSIAQRLARTACEDARKLVPMDPSIKLQIENQFKDLPEEFRKEIQLKEQMYNIVPTEKCPSGTKGRTAIFEMFKVDQEMQNIILKNPVDSEIYKIARKNGMFTMQEDVMLKALDGIVPYKEVFNFTKEGGD
ncbi:MAG: GspE/PulE family protein [Candidatus Pacebacteria bacterium]|nr:GspE/PulE family protein [Candidatus Paceibacterota bacterium]MCF7862560.1 GspE/PulE family protein [Candidatus Paceibacterota bacterium]